ncbi:glycerophosphodiester phosphodiesterase family protein [Thermococcus camini]|nr:glycerophosphodiester phosphodiesterase family protein [Thermococcus camini]
MDSERPLILGHRGVRGRLENTLPSFERVLKYADGVEFDVRLTRDGKLLTSSPALKGELSEEKCNPPRRGLLFQRGFLLPQKSNLRRAEKAAPNGEDNTTGGGCFHTA